MTAYHPQTMEDYCRKRGITDEDLEEARRITERYIRNYERLHHPLRYLRRVYKEHADRRRAAALRSGNMSRITIGALRRYAAAHGGTVRITVELPDRTFSV